MLNSKIRTKISYKIQTFSCVDYFNAAFNVLITRFFQNSHSVLFRWHLQHMPSVPKGDTVFGRNVRIMLGDKSCHLSSDEVTEAPEALVQSHLVSIWPSWYGTQPSWPVLVFWVQPGLRARI